MEMFMKKLVELVPGKLVELAMAEVSNFANLEDKATYLGEKLDLLVGVETDVRKQLEKEESDIRGKKRKREVEDWLKSVVRKRRECEKLIEDVRNCRFFFSRGELTTQVVHMVQEVMELIEQSRCFQGLVLDNSEPKKVPLVTSKALGDTFEHNLERIWARVMDDTISSIGIHGMGGVGKTTLALRVHDNLLRESKFGDRVYWITVSQDFSICRLQEDIAKTTGIDLSNEKDEKKRAGILCNAMKKKSSFVLLLDDVWKDFDAEKIGVPSDVCKLIVTSRSEHVCRQMGCKKLIQVEVLSESEAWELFKTKNDNLHLPPESIEIAQKVAKRCGGLPLGIITVARSMRGVTNIHEWRDALEELEQSFVGRNNMQDEVLPILLYSFNRLKDPKLQSCFLFCSLYPEDYEFRRDELVQKFITEGLMDKRSSRRANFDQGHATLNKLENASLLVSVGSNGLKMHDLIRDMALWITRETKPRFMVKAGMQLEEVPPEDDWAHDLNRVSLMHNRISIIPDGISPRCPNLSSLYLNVNPYLTSVSGSFFMHMKSLHTLDLSDTNIVALPDSVSLLATLKALLLRNCRKLVSLPSLENLKALTELDLYNTSILEVIHGLESLTNLKCLDLQHYIWNNTAALALHGLISLQRLILPKNKFLEFEEVKRLRHLEEFQGGFSKMNEFRQFMISMNSRCQLRYYHLFVGESPNVDVDDIFDYDLFYESDFVVCINDEKTGEIAIDDEMMLPLRDIGFLRIEDAKDMKCLLRVSRQDEEVKNWSPLECLKGLYLSDLPELKNIIEWEGSANTIIITPPAATFSSLIKLKVYRCNGMKKLLPLCLVDNLRNLEELWVMHCSGMEEIIFGEDNEGEENNMGNTANTITLPKLKELILDVLPKLKSICKSTIICNSIQKIRIYRCKKLKKIPLFFPLINGQQSSPSTFSSLAHLDIVIAFKGMKKLMPLCLVDNLRNLEKLRVGNCSGMEEIIFGEDNEGEENNMGNTANTITLPKLKELSLWELPELKSICKSTIICNSIRLIRIKGCTKLKKIPLSFPLINGQQSPPSTLQKIVLYDFEREWWDSLEWDHPHHNNILQPFLY